MNCARCQESLGSKVQIINFASDEYSVCDSCVEELREFMKNAEAPIPVTTNNY